MASDYPIKKEATYGMDYSYKLPKIESYIGVGKVKGKWGESAFLSECAFKNLPVKRAKVKEGGDYWVKIGGKSYLYEIKTYNARLSPNQKKAQAELGERYRVVRYPDMISLRKKKA
jgi:hypothetical protein